MPVLGTCMVPHPPLIVGSIGKDKKERVRKTIRAYHKEAKRIALLKPQTIIVISPHAPLYADYFHVSPGEGAYGDFYHFGAPEISMHAQYDVEFTKTLENLCKVQKFPAGMLGEKNSVLDHGTMVPLYFVNQYFTDYSLVRLGLSSLSYYDHYRMGQFLTNTAQILTRSIYCIASGDLSHKLLAEGPYGYAEEGPLYDSRVMEAMANADFLSLFDFTEDFCNSAAECGHRSFCIMAGVLDRTKVEPEKLSYEGPFGVGYGICAFSPVETDENRNFLEQAIIKERVKTNACKENEDAYVALARESLEHYVKTGSVMNLSPNAYTDTQELHKDLMCQKAGVFVSIKKQGKLRGCIGTISPVHENIALEIIHNAVSAAVRDHRFESVKKEELLDLIYSVDVLGPIEEVSSETELDPEQYGVIVTSGMKRGLLLPNLEGVNTVNEQIAIAKRKAGIGPKDTVSLERFEIIRHK